MLNYILIFPGSNEKHLCAKWDTFAKVDLVTWEDLEEEAKHQLSMGVKEKMITSGLQILLETFIKWKVRR